MVTSAKVDFAWKFWINVSNWLFDKSIESVRLNGPFVTGTTGVTKPAGGEPVDWAPADVREESKEATIEISANDATVRFHWRFEAAGEAGGGARLTQRLNLCGSNAEMFREQISEGFAKGIPSGMEKLAAEIERAQRVQQSVS